VSRFEKAEATLLRYKLDQPVGGSGVSAMDVVLVELSDSDGATGMGFSYVIGGVGGEVVLAAARSAIERLVLNHPLVPPQSLWRRIMASFNRTGLGPNMVALAAIDVAAWDLEANRRGVPLGVAMGGSPRAVPVYGSGGFTADQSPGQAAETALAHAARGLSAVKPRVGGGSGDAALMGAVRAALPAHVEVMFDANENCDFIRARRLLSEARDHGALFVEEPLPAYALAGYRSLAASGLTALAAGEHLQGRTAFLPFVSESLVGLIQPDLSMAGGLTPVLEIATLAEAFDVSMSPHFLPGLFVHVASVSPAVTWLEEFPLLEPLFEGWPELGSNGLLEPREVPGHGLGVAPDVRKKFTLRK
jgi:L-alanine-DL-glutamate epimerase-like enolase superfamily enzyme